MPSLSRDDETAVLEGGVGRLDQVDDALAPRRRELVDVAGAGAADEDRELARVAELGIPSVSTHPDLHE